MFTIVLTSDQSSRSDLVNWRLPKKLRNMFTLSRNDRFCRFLISFPFKRRSYSARIFSATTLPGQFFGYFRKAPPEEKLFSERVRVPYALSVIRKYGGIRFVIPAAGMIVFLEVVAGQQAQPSPTTPLVAPKMEEVPTPSGAPEPQAAPDLLPESNQLPAEPADLRLPSPSILKPERTNATTEVQKLVSAEEQEKNRARLVELRALAMRNPRVIDLLKEANGAMMDEAKREFMRAYYHTLCTRMRQLDPTLGQTITAFERDEIRKLAAGPSRLAIVSRDLLHRERTRHGRRSD